jgi:hypothetical protein
MRRSAAISRAPSRLPVRVTCFAAQHAVSYHDPAAVVVGQDPPGGVRLPRDRIVRLWLKGEPRLIEVPHVIGEPLGEAVHAIEARGLRLEQMDREAGTDAGVIRQEPEGGARRARLDRLARCPTENRAGSGPRRRRPGPERGVSADPRRSAGASSLTDQRTGSWSRYPATAYRWRASASGRPGVAVARSTPPPAVWAVLCRAHRTGTVHCGPGRLALAARLRQSGAQRAKGNQTLDAPGTLVTGWEELR